VDLGGVSQVGGWEEIEVGTLVFGSGSSSSTCARAPVAQIPVRAEAKPERDELVEMANLTLLLLELASQPARQFNDLRVSTLYRRPQNSIRRHPVW